MYHYRPAAFANYNYTESQLTETLRKRKGYLPDDTATWSIFAFIGVYLLSVVDAYVDAEAVQVLHHPRPQHESGTCHNQQPDDSVL